jgi:hypothetical protein
MKTFSGNDNTKKTTIGIGLISLLICICATLFFPKSINIFTITSVAALAACGIAMALPRSWKGRLASLKEIKSILILQIACFLLWIASIANYNQLSPANAPVVSHYNLLAWAICAFFSWKIKLSLQKSDHISFAQLITKKGSSLKTVLTDAVVNLNILFFVAVTFSTALIAGLNLLASLLAIPTAQVNTPAAFLLSLLFFFIALKQKSGWTLQRQINKKRKVLTISANKLLTSLIIFIIAYKVLSLYPGLYVKQPASPFSINSEIDIMRLASHAIFYCQIPLLAFMIEYNKTTKPISTILAFAILPITFLVTQNHVNDLHIPTNISFLCGIIGAGIIFYQLSKRNNFSLLTKLDIDINGAKFRSVSGKLTTLFKMSFLLTAIIVFSSNYIIGILCCSISLGIAAMFWLAILTSAAKRLPRK